MGAACGGFSFLSIQIFLQVNTVCCGVLVRNDSGAVRGSLLAATRRVYA